MHTTERKLATTVVVSAGLLGLGGFGMAGPWPRTVPADVVVPKSDLLRTVAAPEPAARPIEGDWLPKKDGTGSPPTVFPNLKAIGEKKLSEACPHLFGDKVVVIEPTDSTPRRLLKARLHQATLEAWMQKIRTEIGCYFTTEFLSFSLAVKEIQTTTIDLWADDPGKLIPSLEEVVILTKEFERLVDRRVAAGSEQPHQLHLAYRQRLAAEAALWKAKTRLPDRR